MSKRKEVMLVKQSHVETVLQAVEPRRMAGAQSIVTEKRADLFDEMFALFEAQTTMQVKGGVAIIPVRGTILPDDPFAAYFGDTSLTAFQQNLDKALASDEVKAIVLNIFSPGGYVYGVEAAANALYAARGNKPIYAYTDSLAASAAYWLASAADKVILGSETAEVGSIGVYLAHFDYSEMLKEAGIKVTEITSGEYKGLGSPYTELTTDEKKLLQADSNYVYTRFVNTVARNRGMSAEDVLKSANGLTYYGSKAIELGLADSINSLTEVIAMTTATQNTDQAAKETQEAKEAKAQAEAKAATLEAENKTLKEKLAAKEAKDTETANAAAAEDYKAAVKAGFGREATKEEIETFTASNEAGRKALIGTVKEAAARTEQLVKTAKLTSELATEGLGVQESGAGLLTQAAERLGFATATK